MRLIDADALLSGHDVRKVVEFDEGGWGIDYLAVPAGAIVAAPTIDAVEVIRCKDCKMLGPYLRGGKYVYCDRTCMIVREEDYCSYGERKMDAEVQT